MNLTGYIKKLSLPANFNPPILLQHGSFVAKPLQRADLQDDLEAVNSSLSIIRSTRGGNWPEGELSAEFNALDLAWHEREFRDRDSFAYTVRDGGRYVGCFYIYALGVRAPLTKAIVEGGFDADLSWWVTQDAYEKGTYDVLYKAVVGWMREYFPFEKVFFSNKVIPGTEAS